VNQQNPDLQLPHDLIAFLNAGGELAYDPEECDAGRVELVSLPALRLQHFPYDPEGTPLVTSDPLAAAVGCYLVPGVSLIATSEDYNPVGLLLWLPDERRYGTWDDSHNEIRIFGERVSWARIAANPARCLNLAIVMEDDEEFPQELLVPSPRYRFHEPCVYEPLPLVKE
jgi:hypothetical protein